MFRSAVFGLVVGCVLVAAPVAQAEAVDASKANDEGKALLAKGDFEGALAAFKAAAEADPKNQDYFQRCVILRRVIELREELKTEQDSPRWSQIATALYDYYTQHRVYGEALALAQTMHAKSGCGDSAALVARAQFALGKDADVAKLLGSLCETKRTAQTTVLHGLALAHLGRLDEAKACVAELEFPKECDNWTCYYAARLYARLGESDRALQMLRCAFETTPVYWLGDVKDDVRACSDLQTLATSPEFAKVMQTESKVKGCCPSSKGCSKSCSKAKTGCKGQAKDKDKE